MFKMNKILILCKEPMRSAQLTQLNFELKFIDLNSLTAAKTNFFKD